MLNKMYSKLLKEGFSRKTLSTLSEKQISVLFKKIISEQGGAAEKLGQLNPEIEKVTKGLSYIQNQVSKLVGEDDNEEEMDDDNQLTQTQKSNDGLDPDQRVSSLDKGPSDYGNDPEADKVMDKNDADGMSIESEIKERAVSKQQQKFMGLVKSYKEGDTKPSEVSDKVKKASKSMTKTEIDKFAGTKHKGLPTKVKEMSYGDKVRQIEESLLSLVSKYTAETMTKKDLLGLLESPGTKEAPTKDPKTIPDKPDRKTPYQPKHQPKPKARLPKGLSFDELNITFKDEKKD
jgi:hypothetical protein